MTFSDREKSSSSAAPLELFIFRGTFNTYRMTSAPREIVNSLGTFESVTVTRSNIQNASQEQEEIAIDISIPYTHPLVSEYVFVDSPPELLIDIYRVHRSYLEEFELVYSGEVASYNVEDGIASFRVPTIFSYKLEGLCPEPKYQGPCNHILFDNNCGVSRAGNSQTSTVSAINSRVITVAASSFAANDCRAGEMVWAGGGQRRMIISNNGNQFNLSFPFVGIEVGDTVEFTKGCNHSFTTCREKFSNGINFGGCPLVPKKNPFKSAL